MSSTYFRLLLILCALMLVGLPAAVARDFDIYLKYATFDPIVGEPPVPADLRTSPAKGEQERFLAQFDGPIKDEWKQSLTAAGAEIVSYIPNFAFLVKMTPEQAEAVRTLPHVRWVGAYHAAYKLDRKLAAAQGSVRARVSLAMGKSADSVRKEIEQLGGIVQDQGEGPDRQLVSTLPAKALAKIARLKDVDWIEPKPEYKLFNNVARGIVNLLAVWSNPGLFGTGEIVAVCDTGLDMGTMGALSADFSGRLLKAYPLGRKKEWNDPSGHGTHVCGTVLGNGSLSGSNPATHNYTGSYAGAAPEAQLIIQSVLDSSGKLGGIPSNLTLLFSPPYGDGARVHSNSWGSASTGVYTTDSHNVDLFTWNNKDFVIVFAAGNEGKDQNSNGVVDSNSISSPGSAKNCITVGASENLRSSGGYQFAYGSGWPSDYPTDPIKTDFMSNNTTGMAAFSSRGPTADGRIKPDVVAPGTNIISCRSHLAGSGTLWGALDSNYCYSGGTSMSTPLVAGTAALIRQYYRTYRSVTPSAALIKATVINGATDLYPGQYGSGAFLEEPTTRPNMVEGWGRIDASYAISPTAPRSMQFVDNATGLGTGGSVSYLYSVSGNPSPLRVTLVWTDYPASTSASVSLVNDLDLTVIGPDNTVWMGNGSAERRNNVEGVDIANPIPGDYTVQVRGYNVPNGPQPFALVVTAAFGPLPPNAIISSPAGGAYLAGQVAITGTAAGTGFEQYVLEYGAGSAPMSWTAIGQTQTTPMEGGLLGTWDTSALADGDFTIRLTVTGTGGTSAAQRTVHVLTTSVRSVLAQADEDSATLTGKVVSGIFGGFLHVQEPNRTSGIRVNPISMPPDATVGSLVTVTGTLRSINGERVIDNAQVQVTGP